MNSLENLEEQVKKLAVETDDAGRRKLSLLLRDLSYSLEAPKDTITRIASYVSKLTNFCILLVY